MILVGETWSMNIAGEDALIQLQERTQREEEVIHYARKGSLWPNYRDFKTQIFMTFVTKQWSIYLALQVCVIVFTISFRLSSHIWFPGGSDGKKSACSAGDLTLIPGLGRCPGERNGNPLQYSCLENSMERGAWWAIIHGVPKSRTWLSK